MREMGSPVFTIVMLVSLSLTISGSRPTQAADNKLSGNVTILQAASLADLFKKAKAEFTKQHPDVTIRIQPGGSLALTRQILDLNKEADIIAVADATIIPDYLLPKHVDWSVDFLREQMTLVVGENATYAGEITAANWPQILLRPDVEYGIGNPDAAPIGYRSLMVWQLAEEHYALPKLYDQLRTKLPQKNIRQNAAALMTLLKNEELDYIFDYASLATQHGMRAILLPKEINLGDPQFAEQYARAEITVRGKTPSTVNRFRGEPIVYSIAILKNSKNPKAAEAFVNFLVGLRGQELVAEVGMTPLVPARVVGQNLPPLLQATLLQR